MSTLSHPHVVTPLLAIRRFAVHFLEMCVVMCMGGGVLNVAVFGAIGALGRPRFVAETSELAALIIGINLAIAMAAYMAVRGHPARHNVEMSLSSIVGAIPFAGALSLGILPRAELDSWLFLYKVMCGPICLVMLGVMIWRFDHYGGRHGSRAPAQATAGHAGH